MANYIVPYFSEFQEMELFYSKPSKYLTRIKPVSENKICHDFAKNQFLNISKGSWLPSNSVGVTAHFIIICFFRHYQRQTSGYKSE